MTMQLRHPRAIVTTTSRKHRIKNNSTLPMELPLSRKPIERDGADYKRLKAGITVSDDCAVPTNERLPTPRAPLRAMSMSMRAAVLTIGP
jgi:hypothetical protein